jgi:hypothetical protein
MTKKSNVKFARNVSKEQFQKMFEEFQSRHGYMTKLVEKFTLGKEEPCIDGYLVRAEIPEYDNFVAITFIRSENDVQRTKSARFLKSIGMNVVLTAGERKLKQYIKENGSLENFKSESILNCFVSVDEFKELIADCWNNADERVAMYAEYLDYIKAFENKIQKYYGDKEVKIVVV